MKTTVWTFGLVLLLTLGCSPMPSGPDVEQVKKDLVGQSFEDTRSGAFLGGRISVAAVQDVEIQERYTDKAAKTEELRALVTATLGPTPADRAFRGILALHYKYFEQGWKLQSVEAK